MINFLDGPALDAVLDLQRAPKLLRVVISPAGEVDALDQLDDEPKPREKLYAYQRIGEPTQMHLRCSKPKRSGWYMSARYRLVQDQPIDAVMRDNKAWQEWCLANGPGLLGEVRP
jgi:hypothetical protein